MPSLPTGENSKDIVSKLGNENSLKGAQSCGHDDERRRHRKRKKRERKRGREKIKNQREMQSRVIPIATGRSRLRGKTNDSSSCYREEI